MSDTEDNSQETTEFAKEEECKAHFTPLVDKDALPTVDVSVKNDDEEEIYNVRAKLYRFDSEANEWKERGVGQMRFLQHKVDKRVRALMRRDKIMTICANHTIFPEIKLSPNVGSDKAWVYTSPADFADNEQKVETFAIRFQTSEIAQEFKTKFEEAQKAYPKKEEKKEEEKKEE
ncbi:predicted protein [Naegleria gruberi]|uniref:Predicted protein n=1 Tax=Naegleria gruberi TaxID=5762 RepID=D2VI48_NAEGR|nr:uncharacterized protein NAEGRDRAFT_36951 [Naegleria gruberi]EFC43528.1 predicted protein [Naegleria gruberi]|eukprot:XP_002676272.1 predicted protein [Naegleria gruberi strain NEG-M]